MELVDYTDVESVIESAVSLRDAYEEFNKTISYDDIKDQIDDMITSINQTIYLLKLK